MKRVRRKIVDVSVCNKSDGGQGTNWWLKLECGHTEVRHRRSGYLNADGWKYHAHPKKYCFCRFCAKKLGS